MIIDLKNEIKKNSSKNNEGLLCFDVFIIASGLESSLNPLCESSPKSLVKVANKPILAYQLEFLERKEVKQVTVITQRKYYQDIANYLENDYRGTIDADILQTNKDNLGSLEIFSLIKSRLNYNNFILLTADSILDFNFNDFIDRHILEDSLVSLILLKDEQKFVNQKLKYLSTEQELNIFGLKTRSAEQNYKQLVFHARKFDDGDEEKIIIPKKLLNSCPDFDIIYNYEDIHLYIFNRGIYALLEDEKISKLNSIKVDFIPYLINNQNNLKLRNLIAKQKRKEKPEKCLKITGLILDDKNYAYRVTNLNKLLTSLSEVQKTYEEIPKIYFYTKNNTSNIFQKFAQQIQTNLDNDRPYFEGLDYVESITLDSLVADPINTIGKKARINKCIIGTNVSLLENSKLNYCQIYDNVKIGKNCKITNCIIGDNVLIEDDVTLTDCVVPEQTRIEAKSEYLNCTINV